MRVELFHLHYFLAVADELNLTRAAARLHLAASPLSRRIRDLERELGTPLFVRSSRGMALTAAGRALLPRAREIVRRVESLPGELAAADGHPVAAVGIAPDVSAAVRDGFLERVRAAHPELAVRIRPGASAELARSVGRGDLDLAFVHGRYDDDPQLAQRRVDSRPAGVAVGHGLGFDDRTGIRLDELTDLPYVSIRYDAAPSVYRATGELLARHGVHGRIELDTHNPGDLTHVVAAGQAFTLVGLGSGATHKAFVGEPVHVLPVLGADVRIGTEAVWRTDRAAADDVVRLLVAAAPGPGDGGPA
ncbi:LysR family transcriptional regulator [Pseudonocardia sp. P1]|nr:Aromatic hydrocarbon utilization transcriptional regulator CatR (LysR family) [Pseudonocardia sp. Ae707_Ps1]